MGPDLWDREGDYVFTDAMTFTDKRGKRIRLWIRKEVQIDDKQDFMDMYVDKIVTILNIAGEWHGNVDSL